MTYLVYVKSMTNFITSESLYTLLTGFKKSYRVLTKVLSKVTVDLLHQHTT